MTKKFEISDILSAVDSIAKIDKEKRRIKEKKIVSIKMAS